MISADIPRGDFENEFFSNHLKRIYEVKLDLYNENYYSADYYSMYFHGKIIKRFCEMFI